MVENKFIIIAGATKSGTTSLFNYLGDHPDVCMAIQKETRFFLNENFEESTEILLQHYKKQFGKNFQNKTNFVEASSEYLNEPSVSKNINTIKKFGSIRLIFILRNPVERFISWYKFALQDGKIKSSTTLEDFYNMNLNMKEDVAPIYLKALEHGNYSNYLDRYKKRYDDNEIGVFYFDDMVNEFHPFMSAISEFTGLDGLYYKNYSIEVYNKTNEMKYPVVHGLYKSIKKKLRKNIGTGRTRNFFKIISRVSDSIYGYVNPANELSISDELNDQVIKKIEEYYKKELEIFRDRKY